MKRSCQSVEKVAECHFFELSQVLPLAFAPGRQNLQRTNPSGVFSVLTHTPQGTFSCPCGAIHLVSSEPNGTYGAAATYQPRGFRQSQSLENRGAFLM